MTLVRRITWILVSTAIILALIGASTWFYLNPTPPRQQLFTNGVILTMDQDNSVVESILVEDDRIIAIGTEEAMEEMASFDATVVDLDGMTLLPGFIEAHGHFPGSGLDAMAADLNSPPIGDVLSISDIKKKLNDQARSLDKDEWILGFGFDDTLILERRFLNRDDLDSISTTQPVFVMHISGHMSIVNSFVLDQMGIDDNTPNPEGGEIVRDAKGRATGLLKETAQENIRHEALNAGPSRLFDMLADSVRDYLLQGVTTVQSGLTPPEQLTPMGYLVTAGLIPQRMVFWPDEDLARDIEQGQINPINNDKVTTGALKLVTDGSIQGYTGFLSQPYFKQPKDKKATYQGYPSQSPQALKDQVAQWHQRGWQLALHANGDAAIDQVLDAIEQAQKDHPREDTRHIIVHAQTARHDQLERMAKLGVTPTFFPSHIYYWGDRHKNLFLGQDRANQISPLKSASDKGVRYTIHTDTPVVPIEPLLLVSNAVNRETSQGNTLGEAEKISVIQALRATTIDAAWQVFREQDIGSIEPGKLADFVVLSDNPLEHARELETLDVVQTWIGGVKRYDRDQFRTRE
ncbi:amidohydrolase [Endozoicomonas arenosclerae]|uniref:amidohydrolase n=1 Tax=Endozoicomonas arenosclerae TaxID=1633495 RepID=UPI0007819249|nr:amidohydrolase [Endozoicomonas arenosclerae]